MRNKDARKWLIWSMEHNAWWRPDSNGYTSSWACAGRFTFWEAFDIVDNANYKTGDKPHEAMIAENEDHAA